jgi:osmotically inducible protein OsmC
MAIRTATADWEGTLQEGWGNFSVQSGTCTGTYRYGTRFDEERGANPEELIGAAHAACVSMSLANVLNKAGYFPKFIRTTANVHLNRSADGFQIGKIELYAEGDVDRISADEFQKLAEAAKDNSPVTRALAGTEITIKGILAGKQAEEMAR